MNLAKRNNGYSISKTTIVALCSFVISLSLLLLFSFSTGPVNDFSFGLGNVYSASKLSGGKSISLPSDTYYGGSVFISALSFKFAKSQSPENLWNFFIIASAVIRSFVSIIATFIASRFYKCNIKEMIVVGVFAPFISTSFSFQPDAGSVLLFLFWAMILFFHIFLENTDNRKCIVFASCSFIFVVMMIFADFNAISLFISLVIVIALYLRTKKISLIKWYPYAIMFIASIVAIIVGYKFIFARLFGSNFFYSEIINSPWWYMENFKKGITILFREFFYFRWFRALLDFVVGNVFETIVITFGLFSILLTQVVTRKGFSKIPYAVKLMIITFIVSVARLYVENLDTMIRYRKYIENVAHGVFGVECYGYILGFIMFATIYLVMNDVDKTNSSSIWRQSTLVIIACMGELYLSFGWRFFAKNRYLGDWFGSFATKYVRFFSSQDNKVTVETIVLMFLLAVILAVINFYVLNSDMSKFMGFTCGLLFVIGYFGIYYVDGYNNKYYIYSWQMVDFTTIVDELDVDCVYSQGSLTKTCLLDLALENKELIHGMPSGNEESYIVHSLYPYNKLPAYERHLKSCYQVQFDENEYLFVCGEKYIQYFIDNGYEIEDVNTINYSESYVCGLYRSLMDRNGDIEGIEFWVNYLNDGGSLYDVTNAFILSGEFANINANKREFAIVRDMFNMCGLNPSNEDLLYWTHIILMTDDYNLFFKNLFTNEKFVLFCEENGIIPYNEHSFEGVIDVDYQSHYGEFVLKEFINQTYTAMFGYRYDDAMVEYWYVKIVSGEVSTTEFIDYMFFLYDMNGVQSNQFTFLRELCFYGVENDEVVIER